ncbi:hypothetical protein ACWCPT_35275, partial [Streptomyces sp. NPDC002308]
MRLNFARLGRGQPTAGGRGSRSGTAITGESAPVIRESGGVRSAVTGGTNVLSHRLLIKITKKPGETENHPIIKLVD